jgi:hypothetical protein
MRDDVESKATKLQILSFLRTTSQDQDGRRQNKVVLLFLQLDLLPARCLIGSRSDCEEEQGTHG